MTAIAFFDLDRTLIASNSAIGWLWQEITAGNVRPLEGLKGAVWLTRYSLGAADMATAVTTTIGAMKGRSESDLKTRMSAFYESSVRPRLRPGARQALARHRANGDRLVLLTSSSKYLSQLVVRDFGLDEYYCTDLEVGADGLFTGQPVGHPCFGVGKIVAARRCAEAAGIALSVCTFYTDSASDLPMLEAVGHPVAVNPDLRLGRIARARHWPIEDWGKPS